MTKQSYNNHRQYYPAHHFIFYPIVLVFFTFSIYKLFTDSENTGIWFAINALLVLITFLSLLLRQHYALNNQNRIIRLELRLRYYILTQKRFEELESRLTRGQLYALRFASDEELPELISLSLQKNLSPDEIKRSVKVWLADDMRV